MHISSLTVDVEPSRAFGGVKDSGFGGEGGRWSTEEVNAIERMSVQQGRKAYPF